MKQNKIKKWMNEHEETVETIILGAGVLGIASSMTVVTTKICDVIIYKTLGVKL